MLYNHESSLKIGEKFWANDGDDNDEYLLIYYIAKVGNMSEVFKSFWILAGRDGNAKVR